MAVGCKKKKIVLGIWSFYLAPKTGIIEFKVATSPENMHKRNSLLVKVIGCVYNDCNF